ncbi:helix-turn-helix domain-containing protein [Clostridium bovifaecis]|uniref:Glycerol operon regulatory protein n=1 Tax=Clostridium bovifaecis TaxID=2184719 RepID=A0A6I6EM39_9CLOT|nr:helix-turn-helix domain-containing protein [Clostridium bovifaecis]
MNNNSTVQSVDRAINILEELSKEKEGLGLTELSQLVGLHKSTTHRLLLTLMERGYVDKNPNSGKYLVGVRTLNLGAAVLDRMDVKSVARPYVEKLSKETNEVVHLVILDGNEAVYIDKVESPKGSIRMYSQIGRRAPLYCTGVGKVLLTSLDNDTVRALMSGTKMIKHTKNTITNIDDLIEELDKIRKQGYGMDEVEHEEGIRCVSCPIYGMDGKIVAGISVSGPVFFITEERIPELIKQTKEAARSISSQLGYKY